MTTWWRSRRTPNAAWHSDPDCRVLRRLRIDHVGVIEAHWPPIHDTWGLCQMCSTLHWDAGTWAEYRRRTEHLRALLDLP